MQDQLRTPDFDVWQSEQDAVDVEFTPDILTVSWSDGVNSQHHVLLLRENSPDPVTIHPLAREMAISPCDIAEDISIEYAEIDGASLVKVQFSDGLETFFDPGWLRGTAWFADDSRPEPILWTGNDLSEPPTFDGPETLESSTELLKWLEALRDYGVARLRGLPQEDGLLERIVTSIGPVRESNFGRQYVLQIKDDPDSQAYTSGNLLQHIDLPTRETPFGLQFLFTRENSTSGGEGIYVDAYRIAEDMREEEPEHFKSLSEDLWEYNNRARNSDYRGCGPVIETDAHSKITGIRYNTFLRAPMRAPVDVQGRAYKAYRAFCSRAQDPSYEMRFRYEAGDLLAFDNRRVLHGRAGYDAKGGSRFIEGIYSDRDELHSKIRILRRQMKVAENQTKKG